MDRFKVTLIILASIILLVIPPAVANLGAAVWDGGGGDGLWSNPANWSGDVLPGPASVVRIENTADEVHVDVDVTLSGDGQLHLDGDPGVSPTLVVDSGVTLTLSGLGEAGPDSLT